MLKLITFKPVLGTRSPSSFALKADALLAMSGLPYERVFGDVRKAPRAKLPVLNDGGKLIPDSAHIQHYLESEKGVDFDGSLDAGKMAQATALRRLIEHHFYFIAADFRWGDHPDVIRDVFLGDVPALIRGFIFKMVDGKRRKTMQLMGLGRHTREELIEFGRQDIEAISAILGDKPYVFGDTATSIDASLYGALENVINFELDSPLKQIALKHDNLVAYCDRFKGEFFDGRD